MPAPGAPETVSTVASPRKLTGEEIAAAVAPKCAVPLTRITHWPLSYPQALSDTAAGLAQVMAAYQNCGRCHLADRRTRVVFTRGNSDGMILCIGEGPGKDEDIDGRPFVGASGRLANELFRESGVDPDALCWMNLVGCRPCATRFDKDRPPEMVEKLACSERTLWMLRAIRPRVVLCLGEQSSNIFWPEGAAPAPNSWHTLRSDSHPDDWLVVGVLRHPAYLLRVLPVSKMYGEYAAVRLRMAREIRERMPAIVKAGKLKTWWPGLAYVNAMTAPVAGGGT